MTQKMMPFVCVLLAITLSACTTLAPEQVARECAQTDWERYGLNDGKIGLPTSERASEFSDCQTVGQPADLVAYQAGRTTGLESYCTAERGYQIGYSGQRYQSVCPATLEPDFLQGFERGREDRPTVVVYPSFGIGVGSYGGGYGGISIGIGSFGYGPCWGYYCGYRYKRKRHRYKHHRHRHKYHHRRKEPAGGYNR